MEPNLQYTGRAELGPIYDFIVANRIIPDKRAATGIVNRLNDAMNDAMKVTTEELSDLLEEDESIAGNPSDHEIKMISSDLLVWKTVHPSLETNVSDASSQPTYTLPDSSDPNLQLMFDILSTLVPEDAHSVPRLPPATNFPETFVTQEPRTRDVPRSQKPRVLLKRRPVPTLREVRSSASRIITQYKSLQLPPF